MFLFTKSAGTPVVISLANIACIKEEEDSNKAEICFINPIRFRGVPGDMDINSIGTDETVAEIQAKLEPYCEQVLTINNLTVNRVGDVTEAVATGLEVRGG